MYLLRNNEDTIVEKAFHNSLELHYNSKNSYYHNLIKWNIVNIMTSPLLILIMYTGKNNEFPFLDILKYLKNTHKNPKFGKVRQVSTREFPTKFPDWSPPLGGALSPQGSPPLGGALSPQGSPPLGGALFPRALPPWAEHLVPRALPAWAEHLVPRALPPWAEHLVPRALPPWAEHLPWYSPFFTYLASLLCSFG